MSVRLSRRLRWNRTTPLLLAAVCLLVSRGAARSQEAAEPASQDVTLEAGFESSLADKAWSERARALDDFVSGKAGPQLRVSEIFRLSREQVEALLALPPEHSLQERVSKESERVQQKWKQQERKLRRRLGLSKSAAQLRGALRKAPFLAERSAQGQTPLESYLEAATRYFSLSPEMRDAMWSAYAQSPSERRPQWDPPVATPQPEAAQSVEALERLLEGNPDLEQDYEALLQLDLRDEGAFLWEGAGQILQGTASETLAAQKARYYGLEAAKRAELYEGYINARQTMLDAQAKAREEEAEKNERDRRAAKEAEEALKAATEVERQREQALLAAQEAKSTAARLAAQERARLLAIRAQQEGWSKKISDWRGESERLQEETVSLVQSVAEYEHKELSASMADNLHERVQRVLQQARTRLRERLSESLAGSTSVAKEVEQVGHMPPLTVQKEEVERLRFEVLTRAEELAQKDREVAWERMTARHEDLKALNRARLSVLTHLSSASYARHAGVSLSGWNTVRDELAQMRLELEVRWLQLRKRVSKLSEELAESATTILWGLIQVLLLLIAFRWWRQRGQVLLVELRNNVHEKRREYPFLGRVSVVFWYLIKIRSPLDWWLLGWLIAQFWLTEDWVEAAILWTVYKWLIGGVLVVSLLNAFAVQGMRRSRGHTDKTRQLRIDTLRLICYTGTTMGLILALAEQLVGRGALYRWVRDGAWMVYVPMAVYLLVRWKPTVYERCERIATKGPIPQWVVEQNSFRKSIFGTIVGAVYLMYQGAARRVSRMLMGLESVRKAAAFLLRREVMSNAQEQENGVSYSEHPCARQRHFDPDAFASTILPIGPSSRIDGLISSLDEGRTALVGVVGGRGAGKTSFLTRLVRDSDQRIYDYVIDCPAQGLSSLYDEIEKMIGAPLSDRVVFEQKLKSLGVCVLCVDNLHRLIRPTIGGLAELDEFIAFARGWSSRLSWVIAMGGSAWRYTKRARGNRVFFDQVIELRPWTEDEIVSLLDSRNQAAEIEPDFSTLKLSRPEDEFELNDMDFEESQAREELNSNRRKYYRVLWEYSNGNPGVALHAWSRSLYKAGGLTAQGEQGKCVARVFPNPDLSRIERLSLPVLFTLRAIVQLEVATEAQVVECTNLAQQDCADAIRVAIAAGYVTREGVWLRIVWDWHRAIVTVLFRQHLLAAS